MRWTDWFFVIVIGALTWGAVSIYGDVALIELRAASDGISPIISRPWLWLILGSAVLAILANILLIRPIAGRMAKAATLSLTIALIGSTIWVWAIKMLIHQGAPLGFDLRMNAFAHWYTTTTIGGLMALSGASAFTFTALVRLIRRVRA